MLRFTNLTQANEIGANSYLLDFGSGSSVILDAGMSPRAEGIEALPKIHLTQDKLLKAIFISHAHHDHTGALPLYTRQHANIPIFMTEATAALTDILLHNSVEVMFKQREETQRPEYPLYTHREVSRAAKSWIPRALNRFYGLDGDPQMPSEGTTFRFFDAGHVLGSVAIEFRHHGKKIFYTGDINFSDQTLVQAAQFPHESWDILIIETTRGEISSENLPTREHIANCLIQKIQQVFDRRGSVLIPCFALGKTQETITLLHHAQQQGALSPCPIYIGGLSKAFIEVYDRFSHRAPRALPNFKIQKEIRPHLLDGRSANHFSPHPGAIYLLSSGMMTPKTLSNFLAPHFLGNPLHAIFFIGYCDPLSPAGQLLKAAQTNAPEKQIDLEDGLGPIPIQCEVEHFDLTAHAQRKDLIQYILNTHPKHCILVHGDAPAIQSIKEAITAAAPEINVIIPPPGCTIDLD
jgi:Cft2 family RNA processing exonuclease